ncbi:hypothetical protein LWI29_003581 [Acer saccharum]|uniref:Uncharacterized protein n=1 Tax=Acer saccharum TaxID=4024 RepID=A0AA39RPT9_ACESA|nr:hypothetical protein LWI29_003581 [Acer saccharum]
MLSLCPLVSRLSLATRTSATRILKGKTIPALANSGVQANRVIVTRTFSVKSDLEGDNGSGGSKNKENNASIPPFFHAVSFPDFLNDSREDFDISILWFHTNKEKNAFLGGRHGEVVPIKVNSQILEVPSGILPCYIKESDKEEMYRLHMEDQETQTSEKLAKDFNTAAETVDEILLVRDALKNGNKLTGTKIVEMYQLYKENPEIYTIERLAKDFGVAKGSAHLALFSAHMRHNPPWLNDDGSGDSRNKESNASVPAHFHSVSFNASFAISKPSKEDFEVIGEWVYTNNEDNAFLGGRHGKVVTVYTPEKLAKVYNTAPETVNAILFLRDNRKKLQGTEKGEMYRLYMENPEIYTIDRLAKDFGVAKGSAHVALFSQQLCHNPPWLKSSASHGGEIHRLPLTGIMKADLERWSASSNAMAEERKIVKEYRNKMSSRHFFRL